MTDPQPHIHDAAQEATENAAANDAPGATENAAADDSTAQIASLKDQLLRAMAETENTRRRAQKEREDTGKYAVSNFAKDMLSVADNFRRALDATPTETNDPALKNLVTGIEATDRQLQAALERFGIKKMEPLGKPFNPNFHQVMAEVDDPDQAAGTVLQVLQAGYMIHDRLLREALVTVAKGAGVNQPSVDKSA
jgi:molecular chaperone GrpE